MAIGSGADYVKPLRDGRGVWYAGHKIEDVTTHPGFTGTIRPLVALYDKQHAKEYTDTMTVDFEGERSPTNEVEDAMAYEVRFQAVEAERRSEYVKMNKEAIQKIKLTGCRGGQIPCSQNNPSSVLALLGWESKEHHLHWRGTPCNTRFRAAIEGWQRKPCQGGYYLAETI